MSSATDLLQQALKDLPPGGNVFAYLSSYIRALFYPPLPQSFKPQLLFLSVLLAINLAVVIAAFVTRCVRRLQITPFRLIPHPRGTILAPQNQTLYCITQIAWLATVQAFIYAIIATSVDGQTMHGTVLIKCISWLPLWLTAVQEAWSTAILVTMSLANKDSVSFAYTPAFLNTFFPTLALGGSIAAIVVFSRAAGEFNIAFSHLTQLADMLEQLADSFNGKSVSMKEIQGLLPLANPVIQHMDVFFHYLRAGWVLTACIAFAPMLVYVPAAVAHQRLLSRQIREMRHDRAAGTIEDGEGATLSVATEPSAETRRRRSVKNAHIRLLVSSIFIFVLTTYYSSLAALIAGRARFILGTSKGVQIQALAGLYPMALAGGVVSVVVLMGCISASPPAAHASSHKRTISQDGTFSSVSQTKSWRAASPPMMHQPLGLRVTIPDVVHVREGSSPTSTLSRSDLYADSEKSHRSSPVQTSPVSLEQLLGRDRPYPQSVRRQPVPVLRYTPNDGPGAERARVGR